MAAARRKDVQHVLAAFHIPMTAEEVTVRINGELGRNYPVHEIEHELDSLVGAGLVRHEPDGYVIV